MVLLLFLTKVTSSTPPVMSPLPSAAKLPTIESGPATFEPLKENEYCPFSKDAAVGLVPVPPPPLLLPPPPPPPQPVRSASIASAKTEEKSDFFIGSLLWPRPAQSAAVAVLRWCAR